MRWSGFEWNFGRCESLWMGGFHLLSLTWSTGPKFKLVETHRGNQVEGGKNLCIFVRVVHIVLARQRERMNLIRSSLTLSLLLEWKCIIPEKNNNNKRIRKCTDRKFILFQPDKGYMHQTLSFLFFSYFFLSIFMYLDKQIKRGSDPCKRKENRGGRKSHSH